MKNKYGKPCGIQNENKKGQNLKMESLKVNNLFKIDQNHDEVKKEQEKSSILNNDMLPSKEQPKKAVSDEFPNLKLNTLHSVESSYELLAEQSQGDNNFPKFS